MYKTIAWRLGSESLCLKRLSWSLKKNGPILRRTELQMALRATESVTESNSLPSLI